MAEIGLIASIVGVASAGAKLSLTLYQLADVVGNAATEVRDVASEISLFCSVLRQLDSTLQTAKSTRYSLTAITTAETIMAECLSVFNQIQAVVDKLKRESVDTPSELSLAWTARVKWVFQRSKVALYRSKLESMKTTLLLMLTTLTIAEKASRMALEDLHVLEDENDRALAQSLVITQQVALDKLRIEEELGLQNENPNEKYGTRKSWHAGPEIKVEQFESIQQLETLKGNSPIGSEGKRKQNRYSQVMNGIITDRHFYLSKPQLPESDEKLNQSTTEFARRLRKLQLNSEDEELPDPRVRESVDSAWLSKTVFNDGLTPAARRESWTGNSTAALAGNQVKSLLSRWIDYAHPRILQSRNSPSPIKAGTSSKNGHGRTPSESDSIKPRKQDPSPQRSASPPTTLHPSSQSSTPAAYVFRNSLLNLNIKDQTPRVLAQYLRMFNHSADPNEFSLSIEFDDKKLGGRTEKLLPSKAFPLIIFGIESKQGSMPQFLLKRKNVVDDDGKPWTKRIVSLDALASE